MKEKTRKLVMWICLLSAVLGGFFAVLHASGSKSDHVLEGMKEVGNPMSGMYDIAYIITAAIMVVAVCSILIFVVRQLINNFKEDPKKAKKSLISLGLMVAVVLISFLLAKGNDISQTMLDKNGLSLGASRWIGAACIMVYIMLIAAVGVIIYAEVSKALKKK